MTLVLICRLQRILAFFPQKLNFLFHHTDKPCDRLRDCDDEGVK